MSAEIKYTLITGASMGIGKSLALECAASGRNLLLVALEDDLLAELEQHIKGAFGVSVDHLRADLTRTDDIRAVYDWCMAKNYAVNMLLSNAGLGTSGLYENVPLEKYRTIVLLNNLAAVELTHHFLPMLKAQGEAWIMYTGSMESTIPIPYKAVYSASKHFLYGFALSLREELREFGVHVSILCPGPVTTHAGSLARISAQGKSARLMMRSAEEVASPALKGLLRQRQVIVPGRVPAVVENLALMIPRGLKMRIFHRLFKKFRDIQA